LSFVAPIAGVFNSDTSKSPGSGNGFLEDVDSDGDIPMQEPSGSTSEQKGHSTVDRLSSVISLIRELVRDDTNLIFHFLVIFLNVLYSSFLLQILMCPYCF
jgi:RNA polymerase II C-terminal domain phosphatase-like 1/2